MDEKGPFGSGIAENFEIGDIVRWSKWDAELEEWVSNYGILMEIQNKTMHDRIVSVSIVKPLNDSDGPLVELFTMYLDSVATNKKMI